MPPCFEYFEGIGIVLWYGALRRNPVPMEKKRYEMVRNILGSLSLVSLLAMSGLAQAGIDSSGGGNSVVCFTSIAVREQVFSILNEGERSGINARNPFADPAIQSQISTVESLDLYMHKLPRGQEENQIRSLFDYSQFVSRDEVIAYILSRLDERNSFGVNVRDVLNYRLSWVASDGVAKVSDTGLPILVAPNCLIAQSAHRIGNQVFFDRHLFRRMDNLSQAVLVLHEAIYTIAKDQGASDALKVYEVISLLIRSDEEFFNTNNDEGFAQELLNLVFLDTKTKLSIPWSLVFNGQNLPVRAAVGFSGIEKTYFTKDTHIDVNGFTVSLQQYAWWEGPCIQQTLSHSLNGGIDGRYAGFLILKTLRDGEPRKEYVSLSRISLTDWRGRFEGYVSGGSLLDFSNRSRHLHDLAVTKDALVLIENDQVMFTSATIEWSYKGRLSDRDIQVVKLNELIMDSKGFLVSAILEQDVRVGTFRSLKAGTKVKFDEKGWISPIKAER